jgi:hypothetical protein
MSLGSNATYSKSNNSKEFTSILPEKKSQSISSTPTAKPKKRKKVWSEAYDASSGLNYYYNRLTNVTTWDRPTDEELSLYCDEG